MLYYFLANRLGNMSSPTNEPLNTESIQEGLAQQHRRVLWDSTTAPFRMGTPSTMEAFLISRVAVGLPDALLSGMAYDAGQLVPTPSGVPLDNMCGMCAYASMLRHHLKLDTSHTDTAPNSRILKQVLASLLAIKQNEIKANSRLALLYTMCGRAASKGFPDSVWPRAKAADLSRFHILSICQDAGPLSYTLSVVDSEVGRFGEYDYNGHNSQELLDRSWSADALNREVIVVLNSAAGSGNSQLRHAEGFSLGKGFTFRQIIEMLGQYAAAGKGKVTLSERGSARKLARKEIPLTLRRDDIHHARQELIRMGKMFYLREDGTEMEPRAGSAQDPSLMEDETSSLLLSAAQSAIDSAKLLLAERAEGSVGRSTRTATPWDGALQRGKLLDPGLRERWREWHSALARQDKDIKLDSHLQFAKLQLLYYFRGQRRESRRRRPTH